MQRRTRFVSSKVRLTRRQTRHRLHVMSVQEIEKAISQLPPSDYAELMAWLEEYQAQMWDRQIERDIDSGRLNKLFEEANREYEAGLAKPL